MDFFTTTGSVGENDPWGDVQEANYQLQEPADRLHSYGRDLIRTATRNLLATSSQATDVQRLMGNVESLEFLFYDGTQWRDSWDTSAGDSGLPSAVRVRIHLALPDGPSPVGSQPLEMVIPLLETVSVTNQTQTASGGSQ